MPGMDLEILSGLSQMDDDDMAGAMMGLSQFNYLAGDDDDAETQMMLGALAGYNPELAMMMGWNPFSAAWKGIKALGRGARKVGNALLPGQPFGGGRPARKAAVAQALATQRALAATNPLAQPTPLSAVQPQLPVFPIAAVACSRSASRTVRLPRPARPS